MKSIIEQIKNSIPPSRLIGGRISIKPKGAGEFQGLCPFHKEKTPSFTISDEKGFFHCFGCGAHGDIFGYLMQSDGLSYKEALEKLAADAGVRLPKYSPKQLEEENILERVYQIFEITTEYYHKSLFSNEGKSALEYLRKRGLSDEIIRRFRLSYAPSSHDALVNLLSKNFKEAEIIASTVLNKGQNSQLYNMFRGRVMFPITNKKGRVIAFGGRILSVGEPKYLNSPDNPVFKKGKELFGLYNAKIDAFKSNEVILVEGYIDVLSLINNGINNVVAPLGTAVKLEQISELWNIVDTPIVCLDSDAAGRKAMTKLADEALKVITSKKSLKFLILEGAKDPDEYLSKHGVTAFLKLKSSAIELCDYIFETEMHAKSISTPESRADFKKRLMDHAKKITDNNLSKNYSKYFNDKFYDLFNSNRSKKFVKTTLNETAIVASTLSQDVSLEARILAQIAAHPNLLNDNIIFEELVNFEIHSKDLDKVRNSLLSNINSTINREELLQELELIKSELYATNAMKKAINSTDTNIYSLNEADAREAVYRAFKLISLQNLQTQIEVVTREVINTSNENAFVRLRELKKHEEILKTELDLL